MVGSPLSVRLARYKPKNEENIARGWVCAAVYKRDFRAFELMCIVGSSIAEICIEVWVSSANFLWMRIESFLRMWGMLDL